MRFIVQFSRHGFCNVLFVLGPVVFCTLFLGSAPVDGAIVRITTAVDGNKVDLASLEMTAGAGNPDRVYTFVQLIPATVSDYLSIPGSSDTNTVTVLGTPDDPPPSGTDRLNLISDAALNTGIFNPATAAPGMTVTFPRPVVNNADEDLVFFEFSTGNQTPDPVVVMQPGGVGNSQYYSSSQYTKSGSIAAARALTTWIATVAPGGSCDFDQLTSLPLTASAAGQQKWWALPIDLSDLGVPSGGSVSSLIFTAGDGSRAVDPLMIIGMPTPPLLGDFNRDGQVDAADIEPMMQALCDVPAYQQWAGLSDADLLTIGDLNGDHQFTNADVQALLCYLANGSTVATVPEPSCLFLLAFGAPLALWISKKLPARLRTAEA